MNNNHLTSHGIPFVDARLRTVDGSRGFFASRRRRRRAQLVLDHGERLYDSPQRLHRHGLEHKVVRRVVASILCALRRTAVK